VTLRQTKGGVVPEKVPANVMKQLRGAEVGSLLLEDHLFDVKSRYSPEYADIEDRVDDLQKEVSRGTATTKELDELSKDLSKLEELVAKEDERRADGSTVAQMTRLQNAFTQDLIRELKRAKS
jgi:vacuolar-type H+-ATPase subunit I/STV1